MNLTIKFMILMLIFGNSPKRVIMKPIHMENEEILEAEYRHNLHFNGDLPRPQRQVVQPTWLNQEPGGIPLFIDPHVLITDQNLNEAAVIRGDIQKAVNEGRFAVDTRTKLLPKLPLPVNGAVPGPMAPAYDAPYAPPMVPFQLPSNMPTFEPLIPPGGQPNFMEDMQRMWTEFMDNSRRVFGWN